MTFSEKLDFRRANFLEKQFHITYFFWIAAFLEGLLFQKTLSPTTAKFLEEVLLVLSFSVKMYKHFYVHLLLLKVASWTKCI